MDALDLWWFNAGQFVRGLKLNGKPGFPPDRGGTPGVPLKVTTPV
jgi:hypothetical protein